MKYSFVGAFTVIDLTQFTTKDGQQVTATKKLFVVKGTSTKKLLKRRERCDNNLVGCVIECTRYEKKESGTGSEFELIARLTPAQMMSIRPTTGNYSVKEDEWLKPFDYLKVFSPKSADQLRKILNVPPPLGSDASMAGNNLPPYMRPAPAAQPQNQAPWATAAAAPATRPAQEEESAQDIADLI